MRINVRHTVSKWIANAYLDFVVLSPILYTNQYVCQTFVPFSMLQFLSLKYKKLLIIQQNFIFIIILIY